MQTNIEKVLKIISKLDSDDKLYIIRYIAENIDNYNRQSKLYSKLLNDYKLLLDKYEEILEERISDIKINSYNDKVIQFSRKKSELEIELLKNKFHVKAGESFDELIERIISDNAITFLNNDNDTRENIKVMIYPEVFVSKKINWYGNQTQLVLFLYILKVTGFIKISSRSQLLDNIDFFNFIVTENTINKISNDFSPVTNIDLEEFIFELLSKKGNTFKELKYVFYHCTDTLQKYYTKLV